jgi:hypothetical protein
VEALHSLPINCRKDKTGPVILSPPDEWLSLRKMPFGAVHPYYVI